MTNTNENRTFRPKLIALSDIEPQAVQWLWPNRLPLGMVSILAGRPGGGKSFFSLWLAGRVTRGGFWPDGTPIPRGAVLILANEDPLDCVVVPRLLAQDTALDSVMALNGGEYWDENRLISERHLTLHDISIIDAAIEELAARTGETVRLVIIDPVGSYLGDTKENSNVEVRNVLDPLITLAKDKQVAILLIAHTGKTEKDCAQHGILGSTAFSAVARAVWNIYPDRDDATRRLVLPAKGNIWRNPPGIVFTLGADDAVVVLSDIALTADEYERSLRRHSGTENKNAAPTKTADAVDWLRKRLPLWGCPRKLVVEEAVAAGHTESTIYRAAKQLGVCSCESGSGLVWHLPRTEEKEE